MRIGSESVLGENPPTFYDQSLAQSAGQHDARVLPEKRIPGSTVWPGQILILTKLQIRAQDPEPAHSLCAASQFWAADGRFSQSTVLDISYVGNFGRKENRLRNANQGFVTGFSEWRSGHRVSVRESEHQRQYAPAGNHAFLELATNDGNTNYNGLLVSLKRRFAKGLAYGISYTFSKNFSDFVDNLTGGSTPANAYNYSLERSFLSV